MAHSTLIDTYNACIHELRRQFLIIIGKMDSDVQWLDKQDENILIIDGYYAVSIYTIYKVVSLDVTQEEFYEWYDYCVRIDALNNTMPESRSIPYLTIEDWHNGASRLSNENLRHLESLVAEAKEHDRTATESIAAEQKAKELYSQAADVYLSRPHLFPSRINLTSN